jgi:acetyltransferase-like isoleucine patch superfamily enzyme
MAPRLASGVRRALILATHQHCHVEFRGPVRLGPGFHLEIPEHGTFIVGPGVDFRRGFVCEISGGGRVEIGGWTTFTSSCLVQCSTSIRIGERCAFGQSVLIVDGHHRYQGLDRHWLDQGYDFTPITIGDGVGVSDKCTVFADIGERAMVASHSVVNRPIPAYSVAAGVPARVIRTFGPDQREGGEEDRRERPAGPEGPSAGPGPPQGDGGHLSGGGGNGAGWPGRRRRRGA